MKNMLENIKSKYETLNTKLEEVKREEAQADEVREQLSLDFKIVDDAYQYAQDHFNKIEERINKRREKYAKNKCSRHVNIVGFTTTAISLLIAFINIKLGLITQPFYACMGAILLGCMACVIDLDLFWKKIENKSYEEFEELESTKRTREVSDKAYVEKLKAEKDFRDVQGKIINNTKEINSLKAKKQAIENKINDLKVNAFDEIINHENINSNDTKLVLK